MKIPLVSIIMPVYNRADIVGETLDSIRAQTYTNWECIIVDDGSTDDTARVLLSYIENDSRFKYFIRDDDKIKGASSCRNIGFGLSKGEYIQYLDSDDLLHPNKIEKQLESMFENNADISFSKWDTFENKIQDSQMFRFSKVNYLRPNDGKELLFSFGMENWFVPPISWLTMRTLIEKAGLWNIMISNNDDGEFFSRVLYNAEKVLCVDEIYCFYRVLRTNSLSKLNSVVKINSAYTSYQLIEKMLSKNSHTELLCYPKRLYYIHYLMVRDDFPELAKRSAKSFDQLRTGCFLSRKKKYWIIINWFGLHRGTLLYDFLLKGFTNIKKVSCHFN